MKNESKMPKDQAKDVSWIENAIPVSAYYTLGVPIPIAIAGKMRNSWESRSVSPSEIQASFDVKHIQLLQLFKSEFDVYQCPESLFLPMGDIGVKPAIFEVIYIGGSSTLITETERVNVIPLKAILKGDKFEKNIQTLHYSNKPGDLAISVVNNVKESCTIF